MKSWKFLAPLAIAIGAAHADGQTQYSGNGHSYLVVSSPGADWYSANAAASAMTYQGQTGYLATLTSAGEDAFVGGLVAGQSEAWLGGIQSPITEPVAGAGWTWITGEPWAYTNWNGGEPNDAYGPASEQWLGMWGFGAWNDEGSFGNISAYVVEFNTPEPGTYALLACGLTAFALRFRRRKS